MISDTFIYDPEGASFYSMSNDVGRKTLSGGKITSQVTTIGHNYLPLELVKSSKPLICFTTDDESEDAGFGQEKWQRLHPSCWSNSDVLDVIFYVASKSSHGLDAVHNLRGEKFQGLNGNALYRMTRQDFCDRDSAYGDLLFECIQDLLAKSEFYPPVGISPTKFELNNMDIFKDTSNENFTLPKPVQDLMDVEGDDQLPLNMAAVGRCQCERRDDDCPCVEIGGYGYSIDSATDFSNVLKPSVIHGNDVQLGNECFNYTELKSAKPQCSASIDYNRPIDLSTGPICRRSSHRSDINLVSLTAASTTPHLTYPVPDTTHEDSSCGTQRPKSSSKTWKRERDSVDNQLPTKKSSKTMNGSSNGRHLWEFVRDLLQASDDGDRLAGEIIRWENRNEGIFRIVDSRKVAQLWGERKRNKTMTYEKLSRALRWSRTYGFLSAVPKDGTYPKKLCFRFGELANWRRD